MKEILPLLWALLVTGVVLALAYWFTRHVVGRMAGGGLAGGRRMAVLEQIPLGKEEKLLLVRLGDRLYFLAVTPGGANILRELTQEEAQPWLSQEPAAPAVPDSFSQALRRVLEQRKKSGR